MKEYQLGVMETRFADLIWKHEPVASGELVRICEQEFGWKKSTTYTMLRRLCQRGIFQNQDGTVHASMTKEAFLGLQSEQFVEETFGGSLPAFLTAFGKRKKLSAREIDELKRLIDESRR